MTSFDPFLNYDDVTEEMADDLYAGVVAYKTSQNVLLDALEGTERVEAARAMLEAQKELADTAGAIYETIYTVPMMVHTAGPLKEEAEDDGEETFTVQRCARCGSVLQSFSNNRAFQNMFGIEDTGDLPWWDEGDRIAKSSGDGSIRMDLYVIDEDRDLEPYEYECVDLNQLSGGDD